MLARRFTIVCLLMSLFGMLFAILVGGAGRSRPLLGCRHLQPLPVRLRRTIFVAETTKPEIRREKQKA